MVPHTHNKTHEHTIPTTLEEWHSSFRIASEAIVVSDHGQIVNPISEVQRLAIHHVMDHRLDYLEFYKSTRKPLTPAQ